MKQLISQATDYRFTLVLLHKAQSCAMGISQTGNKCATSIHVEVTGGCLNNQWCHLFYTQRYRPTHRLQQPHFPEDCICNNSTFRNGLFRRLKIARESIKYMLQNADQSIKRHISTLPVFLGVSKFFIKSPGLTIFKDFQTK